MARKYRFGPVRKATNVAMIALLKRGVAAPQKTSFLITTRGRKSGLDRTVPVNLVDDGGERWLVSPYGDVGWVRNLRANPVLRLWRGEHSESLAAEEVDATTAAPILARYVRQVRIAAPYFDARPDAPVEQFAAEAGRHPVFRLKNAPS
jgi:deazaflavin-dependent oxidoreductase (nitroreductase family)